MIEGIELYRLVPARPGVRRWWLSCGSEPGMLDRPDQTSAVRVTSRWLCCCGIVCVVHLWRRGGARKQETET